MKNLILLIFAALQCGALSAQDTAANRKKVLAMILEQSAIKTKRDRYNQHATIYNINPTTSREQIPQGFRNAAPIPRYSLAKGAVICRLEEYVQLHSPFKLNIGVGGE